MRWKTLEDLFQEGVRCTEEWDIWRGKDKSHTYFYYDQLLFLLPHLEDTETQSNVTTQGNEDEKEVNSSQEEKEPPHNVQRKKWTTAKALANSLEAQFQPVTVPLVPAVEVVDVTLRSYFLTLASEPKLTNPGKVHKVIQGLNVAKPPDPNVIPKTALKHLPQRAISLLFQIFNVVLNSHHLPTMRKHDQVISILKPRKDPALSPSYRPIGLLDTIGRLFEKILPARILSKVSEWRLMRDKQFGWIRVQHTVSYSAALNHGQDSWTGNMTCSNTEYLTE